MEKIEKKDLTLTGMAGVWWHKNGGLYLQNLAKSASLTEELIQNLKKDLSLPFADSSFVHTKEMYLSDLGRFPLAEEAQIWLSENIEDSEGAAMQLPQILRSSQIPIFYGIHANAFLCKEAKAVCRFFSQSWLSRQQEDDANTIEEKDLDDLQEILHGFLIISSFTGLHI